LLLTILSVHSELLFSSWAMGHGEYILWYLKEAIRARRTLNLNFSLAGNEQVAYR
jgi:hypothetical protein